MARRIKKTPVTWPKGVNRPTDPISPLAPVSSGNEGTVNIAALLVRGEPRDKKLFGQMIEDLLRSPTGDLLLRTIHQLKAVALRGKGTPELRLGVMEGLEQLLESLELYVVQAKHLKDQEEEEKELERWTQAQNRLGHMPPSHTGAGEPE